jgi:glycine cleavage system H protein
MYPDDRRYSREHEWILVDGSRGRIGITDYAQQQLGDVVFVELPEVGRTVSAGESFGTVESVKAVSELYSPVAGRVAEVNAALNEAPEKINEDPHGAAWMIVLELDDAGSVGKLMDAAAYQAHVDAESKYPRRRVRLPAMDLSETAVGRA